MKRILINKVISTKWLTKELLAAGVNVSGVGQDELGTYAEIAEVDEALTLTVIEAHNPETTPDVLERADFVSLGTDISGEITWISDSGIPSIDTDLGTIDGMTATQVRDVVKRLLQRERRGLLVRRGILRAFRFVIRQLR